MGRYEHLYDHTARRCPLPSGAHRVRQELKNNYACFRLPQDGIDTIVAKLLVSGKARFKCSLDFWRGVAREGDLIFLNIKSGILEDNLIIFAEITIDVIAVVCVVDHFFGESAIESIFDVSERLVTGLQEVPPGLKDITLLGQLLVKTFGYANGEMVAVKSAPDW